MQIVEDYYKLISEVKDISSLVSKSTAEESPETIEESNGRQPFLEKEIDKINLTIHEKDEIVKQATMKLNVLVELSRIIEKIKNDAQNEKEELISKNDVIINELIEIEGRKKEERIKILKQQIKEIEESYEKKKEQLSGMKQRNKSDGEMKKDLIVKSLSILLSQEFK